MNPRTFAPGAKERSTFGKIRSFLPLPNLIDVQRKSYEDFLQMDLLPFLRQEIHLEEVLVGLALDVDEVRERQERADLAEGRALFRARCERAWVHWVRSLSWPRAGRGMRRAAMRRTKIERKSLQAGEPNLGSPRTPLRVT